MKSNSLIWKKTKKGLAVAGLFLCLFLTAVPTFAAQKKKPAQTTEATQKKKKQEETKKKKKQEEVKVQEPVKKEITDNLIPAGNLTLVDDVISASDGNREFLTVMSRQGSYFYIVIDRAMQGSGNVYFLNLVDENDLYSLTGEDAPQMKEAEEETQITLEPQEEEETQPEEEEMTEEEKAEQKKKSLMLTVGIFAAILVGVVIYVLRSRKSKKQKQAEFDLSDFDDDDE